MTYKILNSIFLLTSYQNLQGQSNNSQLTTLSSNIKLPPAGKITLPDDTFLLFQDININFLPFEDLTDVSIQFSELDKSVSSDKSLISNINKR